MVNWRWIAVASGAVLFIVTVILLAVLLSSGSSDECQLFLQPNSSFKNASLLLKPKGSLDVFGFLDADKKGRVILSQGQKVQIACPGNRVGRYGEEVLAECLRETEFRAEGTILDMTQLECNDFPETTVLREDGSCGAFGRGSLSRIGYNVSWGFVSLIQVCFVDESLEPIWAATTVRGHADGAESAERPKFDPGPFYPQDVKPDTQYKQATQVKIFAKILGSENLAARYVNKNNSLNRGHLVAKRDLVWAAGQRATFVMGNVAPQWTTVNGGNWEKLERSVRARATDAASDLFVVTGAWGRAALPDSKGNPRPLALLEDGRMPVPAIFWKVVYENATRRGTAFVALNNPYTRLAYQPQLRLCTDVCDRIPWVQWNPDNVTLGEAYCCEVNALRTSVADLPPLDVIDLLI